MIERRHQAVSHILPIYHSMTRIGLNGSRNRIPFVSEGNTLYWLALIFLPLHLAAWLRARTLTMDTSLVSAWRWAVPGAVCWTATLLLARQDSGLVDHLSCASAVLLMCPFVGVLGARRPGVQAWGWFVLLPMIVVLQWPAVSSLLTGGSGDGRFEMPEAAMIGCGLVCIMSMGNYFGTRLTAPSVLTGVAVCCLLWPLAHSENNRNPEVTTMIAIASGVLGVAAAWFLVITRRELSTPGLDGMWVRFRDTFGIVWAKRVMDRLNQFAERERWKVRLELTGFVDREEPNPATEAEMLSRVRWVMKRFVDPSWLDEHLPAAADNTVNAS